MKEQRQDAQTFVVLILLEMTTHTILFVKNNETIIEEEACVFLFLSFDWCLLIFIIVEVEIFNDDDSKYCRVAMSISIIATQRGRK